MRTPGTTSQTWPAATGVSGGYSGIANATLPDGMIVPLTVQALAQSDGQTLAIYDPTHLLTPSGLLVVPVAGSSNYVRWYETTGPDGQPSTKGVGGYLLAGVNADPIRKDPNGPSLSGHVLIEPLLSGAGFDNSAGSFSYRPIGATSIDVRFNLDVRNLQSCASDATGVPLLCPGGTTCNSGFCTARAPATIDGPVHPLNEIFLVPTAPNITTTIWDDWGISNSAVPTASIFETQCTFEGANPGLPAGPLGQFSGEMTCASSPAADPRLAAPPMGIQILGHNDFVAWSQLTQNAKQPNTLKTGDELLAACLEQVQRKPPVFSTLTRTLPADFSGYNDPSVTTSCASGNPGNPLQGRCLIAANYGPGKYFDPTNACISLGYFLQTAWDVRPNGGPNAGFGGRYYYRLLQEWLELHAFMARQGLQTSELDQILASAVPTDITGPDPGISASHPDKSQLLDVLVRGWALVAAETSRAGGFGGILEDIADEDYLVHPDYRSQFAGLYTNGIPDAGPAPGVRAAGRPAGDDARVDVGDARRRRRAPQRGERFDLPGGSPERRQRDARPGASALRRPRASRALRRGHGHPRPRSRLHDRGTQRGRDLQSRLGAPRTMAKGECAALLQKGLVQATGMITGRNPLGVEDDDVPLFFGDPVGATSRYFASSDYLLSTWAAPAVSSAQGALATARDAWISMRNSGVQDELLAADRDRRIELIGQQYGDQIIANCGLTSVDGRNVEGKDVFDLVPKSQISLTGCFIDSRPECIPPKPLGAGATSLLPAGLRQADANLANLTTNIIKHRLCVQSHVQNQTYLPPEVAQCGADHSMDWSDVSLMGSGIAARVACGAHMFMATQVAAPSGLASISPELLAAASEACDAEVGVVDDPVPSVPAQCLHGTMGDAYSRILSSAADADVAKSTMDGIDARLNDQWALCLEKISDEQERQKAADMLATIRQNWADAKTAALEAHQDAGFWGSLINIGTGIVELVATDGATGEGQVLDGLNGLVNQALTDDPHSQRGAGRGEPLHRRG